MDDKLWEIFYKYQPEHENIPCEVIDEPCKHDNTVQHLDGMLICKDCAVVLGYIHVHTEYSALTTPRYQNDPLKNCTNHLYKFIDKADLKLLGYGIEKRLHSIKRKNENKSLNYALMFHFMFPDNEERQSKIKPFLPKNQKSWKKNREMFEKE